MNEVCDRVLFTYLSQFTEDAFIKVKKMIETKSIYISKHHNWPTLSKYGFPNGMPSLSESSFSDDIPYDYKSVFDKKWREKPEIEITELNGYLEYQNYIFDNELFREKFEIGKDHDDYSRLLNLSIKSFAENIVERYLHLYIEEDEFSIDNFKRIYLPLENSIHNKVLNIDIVIPILFLKFNFESFTIDSNTYIEKLDTIMQLSRTKISNYAVPVNKTVIGAATHALVLKNYSLDNRNKWILSKLLSEQLAYPTEVIDDFFNCFRILFGYETGYAQLISRPIDWCESYQGTLRPLYGTLIRAYPARFDNYYWLAPELPTVTEDQIAQVGEIFQKFQSEPNQKIKIANQRLKYCYLRDNEQDAIIDAMIALETLLSDGERSELNHKLALRMAAILSLSEEITQSPHEIFSSVKKIYDYRSAIVHGNPKAENKREIKLEGTTPIPAVEKAIEFLRVAITVIVENPQYLKASKIDEDLILKSLN